MTGPEHYREAERKLEHALNAEGRPGVRVECYQVATVHALLALAAASALNTPVDAHGEGGMLPEDANAWYAVAGTKSPGGGA